MFVLQWEPIQQVTVDSHRTPHYTPVQLSILQRKDSVLFHLANIP